MKTVTIPGGTASLREMHEIKVRHRRIIETAAIAAVPALAKLPSSLEELATAKLSELNLSKEEATSLFELQDATIVASLDSWTRPEPIPTLDTIGDLDEDVYEALSLASRDLGAAVASGVDFDPSDPRAPGFEATPTSPSDGSAAGLRDAPVPLSTSLQHDTGESIASDVPSAA